MFDLAINSRYLDWKLSIKQHHEATLHLTQDQTQPPLLCLDNQIPTCDQLKPRVFYVPWSCLIIKMVTNPNQECWYTPISALLHHSGLWSLHDAKRLLPKSQHIQVIRFHKIMSITVFVFIIVYNVYVYIPQWLLHHTHHISPQPGYHNSTIHE
jgi:hypothetical protein